MRTYEWAVIGSGISGISIAEILSRQGHSVILIEKNVKLASETTREFHEWLHTGALYTLVPDRLVTLRFILGAIDDLIEFYSSYEKMNLKPTVQGLKVDQTTAGWFNNNYIHFKYRINGRKLTFPWIYGVARSISIIEKVFNHDWLRRRAGEITHLKKGRSKRVIALLGELIKYKELFKTVRTPDFTINSRKLLRDMVTNSIKNGLDISLDNEILKIEKKSDHNILVGSKNNIKAKNIALCNGSGIEKFTSVKTKTSYAPIAVVSGISKKTKSFVELDYFPKNCINLLTKENSYGLAGGISLSDKSKCDEYLNYVIKRHRKLEPNIEEISRYVGIKTEITFKNQPRGYLYHIINTDESVWAIVPGKFSLAFSMAPEFYRKVYNVNPSKNFKTYSDNKELEKLVSNTVWQDAFNKNKG